MTTATTSDPAHELRHRLAGQLTATGALTSPQWREAFAAVAREAFVPDFSVRQRDGLHAYRQGDPGWLEAAYSDRSLLTQFDVAGTATSSSSEPTLMAIMLEALRVVEDSTVLEVGIGTGYNAALLCHRLGDDRVTSIDIDPALTDAARTRLRHAGYAPTLHTGDGTLGVPEHAPYDALLATCGFGRVPDAWRRQVRPGGTIVANIGRGLVQLTMAEDHGAAGWFLPAPATFMRARASADAVATRVLQRAGALAGATGQVEQIRLLADPGDEGAQFVGALVQPDVEYLRMEDGDGRPTHYLVHPATESWARITPLADGAARLDHGGPRQLWAGREAILACWDGAGRPERQHIGLEITPDGGHRVRIGGVPVPLPAS